MTSIVAGGSVIHGQIGHSQLVTQATYVGTKHFEFIVCFFYKKSLDFGRFFVIFDKIFSEQGGTGVVKKDGRRRGL